MDMRGKVGSARGTMGREALPGAALAKSAVDPVPDIAGVGRAQPCFTLRHRWLLVIGG